MTDFSAAHIGIQHRPGKQNLATAAFDALRTARTEGRSPEGASLTFGDLIDTLNPLQHIPLVAEVYRGLTGDGISAHARIAGGTLWGGPFGLVASVASLAIGGNGKDGAGDRVYASLFGGEGAADAPAALVAGKTEDVPAPSPDAGLTTASIAPTPPATRDRPAPDDVNPLPRLSPEAFQALIGSFADPAGIEMVADEPEAGQPANLANAMLDALDKYEAMKPPRAAK
ncbi:MAG: hypothetical protein CVT81_09140 [Alphaproteobacteria bacterium HGW-Alphaproteobacteria-3]|nr:MAG: hypothetical protein CVT81_09140 [Alphaproteobacteria bacterium HGW-Alphaproteobacteria-3]